MFIHTTRFRAPLTGLLAVLLAIMIAGVAIAQTAPLAKISSRPLSRDDLSAAGLPSTMELSGGLFTVGVGMATYLEAQLDITIPASDIVSATWKLTTVPSGSKAALTDSPLTSKVPIYEPSDRLILQVAGRTLLRPDIAGVYVVSVTIVTAKEGTANLAQTIVAANYVGVQTCTMCHSGGLADVKVPSWSKTLHAEIFKDNINGADGTTYATTCWGCHTVGYDTNAAANNGGFDDVMTKLGWTPPPTMQAGNWDAVPAALQNVANIQCENCHGPGSLHAGSGGDTVAISVSTDSGVCGQCHGAATHHIKAMEWGNSLHAVTTTDATGAGRESCVGCHTGTGFSGKIDALKAGNTSYSPMNTSYNPINCQSCHEAHGETLPTGAAHQVRTLAAVTLADGTKVTKGGTGMLCMNCHMARQNAVKYVPTTAGNSHWGPHHGTQTDILQGTNGFTYGKTMPTSAHKFAVGDTCSTCHMQTPAAADPALGQVGGHTFKASMAANGKIPAEDLVAACQTCHGPDITSFDFQLFDYNNDGVIEGVQTEVQHLLDQLGLMLPPVGQAKTDLTIDATWNIHQLEAAWNWMLVAYDGSKGIHNTAYAVALLEASIADMKASTASK